MVKSARLSYLRAMCLGAAFINLTTIHDLFGSHSTCLYADDDDNNDNNDHDSNDLYSFYYPASATAPPPPPPTTPAAHLPRLAFFLDVGSFGCCGRPHAQAFLQLHSCCQSLECERDMEKDYIGPTMLLLVAGPGLKNASNMP